MQCPTRILLRLIGALPTVCMNLVHHWDRTCPAYQYRFCLRKVCAALCHNAHHILVFRVPRSVKRGRASRARFGPVMDVCLKERLR